MSDVSAEFGDELHLVIPPYSQYLRTVRLMAADTAVRAGLHYEDVEDFRLAVDELCHNLMAATDHVVFLSFATAEHGVTAQGIARARSGRPPVLPEMSAMIVRSLADSYSFDVQGTELVFRVTMTRASAHR